MKISALQVNFLLHQLLSAIISCWQLMTVYMKKKSTEIFMYNLILILVPNFNSISWFSFSSILSAIISCWQMLIADDSWYEKSDLNSDVHTIVYICAKFQLSWLIFIFINCYPLLSAVDSWWQLKWKKFNWNFYVYTKVYICAEFQLSRLIFIFINCQQLLSAVESCWQLMTADMKKMTGIFMYTLKLILVPNFGSLGWFSFSSTVISCWQMLWKNKWNLYLSP